MPAFKPLTWLLALLLFLAAASAQLFAPTG
jgi:hypothetical protein